MAGDAAAAAGFLALDAYNSTPWLVTNVVSFVLPPYSSPLKGGALGAGSRPQTPSQ